MLTQIRSKMGFVVQQAGWSEEKKLMELGVLHFYVTGRVPIPEEESLVSSWIQAVDTGASALNAKNKQLCGKTKARTLASGAAMYIRNECVRMIFSSDERLNGGGCIAVKKLLNSRVGRFFGEQQRLQILRVIDKLLDDVDFRNLFRESFTVHPDLAKLIRIDMQLSMDAPLNPLSIRRALLLSLFSLVGQFPVDETCYIVATELNFLSQQCDLLLKLLIKVLKTGTLEFEGNQIPIALLLEGRSVYEEDFATELSQDNIVQLPGYIIARDILGGKETAASKDPITLGDLMQHTFKKKYEDAQEIFLSLKQNLLQQMLLSIFQFVSLNFSGPTHESSPSIRTALFMDIKKCSYKALMQLPQMTALNLESWFNRIEKAWYKHFFFVDCKNRAITVQEDRVTFDFHTKGLLFSGKRSDLSDFWPCAGVRRLYYSADGKLVPVDSLSFLGECLCDLALKEVGSSASQDDLRVLSAFSYYVKEHSFKKAIAWIIHIYNGKLKISQQTYIDSDSFFVIQRGGDHEFILLWDWFKERFRQPEIINSCNSYDFFTQLCHKIESLKTLKQLPSSKHDPYLLARSEDHIFNFNPLHFQKYWGTPELYVETVIQRADKLLSQPLTDVLKRKILIQMVGEKKVGGYLKKLPRGKNGLKKWIKQSASLLDDVQRKKFGQTLERVLQEIDFQRATKDLFPILQLAGLQLKEAQLAEVSAYFAGKGDAPPLTSYEFAKTVQKSLLMCGYGNLQIHFLEEVICAYYGFPEVIDLGNLNYVEECSEKLQFDRLVFKYDFLEGKATLRLRKKGIAENIDNDNSEAASLNQTLLYCET